MDTHIADKGRRFDLGQLMATPGALRELERAGEMPAFFIDRHQRGDWGELDEEDKKANESALKYGYRLLSAYVLGTGVRLWIITEADRSMTTLLLPEEY